jgi:Tol biopolymer transport system component
MGGGPIAWAPDGKSIATTDGAQVKVWDLTGVQIATLPARAENGMTVTALAWSPDGTTLAIGTSLHEVRLYRPDGTFIKTLAGHTDIITALAWSPDGKALAAGSQDKTVRLWKADGTPIATLKHDAVIESISWSRDSAMLATSDGRTRLWKADGTAVATFAESTHLPAWSPDGTVVAVAHDNDVELWRPNGTLITALSGHTSTVESLVWSPDGKTLASGSADGTVRLWH